MAKFLRDGFLKNITITEDVLKLIHNFLSEKEEENNKTLGEKEKGHELLMSYVIRFDNKGYALNDFTEVMKYYEQASSVERVNFTLDSTLSESTNNKYGVRFEVRLDAKNPTNCVIQVTSDDRNTVDGVFHGLMEIMIKSKNRHGLVRNAWTNLLIQVGGVVTGFLISLIAGVKISPYLSIDSAFIICFVFTFLIFSNTWGFVYQQILILLDYLFPNIQFSRKGKHAWHWLFQAIIGGVIVASTLYLMGFAFDWVGQVLEQYIKK